MANINNPLSFIGASNDPTLSQRTLAADAHPRAIELASLTQGLKNAQSGRNQAAGDAATRELGIIKSLISKDLNPTDLVSALRKLETRGDVTNQGNILTNMTTSAGLNFGAPFKNGQTIDEVTAAFQGGPLEAQISPDQATAIANSGSTIVDKEDIVRNALPEDNTIAPNIPVTRTITNKLPGEIIINRGSGTTTTNAPAVNTATGTGKDGRYGVWQEQPDGSAVLIEELPKPGTDE
jgi:hypothetical protein